MAKKHSVLQDLSDKKLSALFWQYALPAIIGTSVSTLYNIINGVFIGHWIGKEALSAAGLILPVMNMAAAIGMLVGVGSASRISIYLGLKEQNKAEQIAGTSLMLTLLLSGLILSILFIFLDPILMFVGASEVTLPYAREFLQIFLPGSIFLTLAFNYNNMMRACGYPFKAMVTMFISVIVNIILAPVFIYWLGWGMRGAAVATTISMAVSFAFVMLHFTSKNSEIRLKKENFKLPLDSVKAIISIGLSPFCMQIAASAVIILINFQINRYAPAAGVIGDDAIGAFANANRLITLIIMIVIGLNQGMQPIIGYNYGAKNYTRVKETFIYAVKVATCITTTGFLLGMFAPELLVMAFSPDPEMIRLSATALRYITISFAFIGFQMVTTSFFQCIGMAKISIILSLSRQVLILIPVLIIMPMLFGLDGVWIASPVSDIFATFISAYILYLQIQKIKATGVTL